MKAYQVPAQVSILGCLWHFLTPLRVPSLLWGWQALAPASYCFNLLPSELPLTPLSLRRVQPLRSHWGSILCHLPTLPLAPSAIWPDPTVTFSHSLHFSTIHEKGSFSPNQSTNWVPSKHSKNSQWRWESKCVVLFTYQNQTTAKQNKQDPPPSRSICTIVIIS